MSYNDRLEELSRWVRSHAEVAQEPETATVSLELPASALADLLHEAAHDPARWPWQLASWARVNARKGAAMSISCWDACSDDDERPDLDEDVRGRGVDVILYGRDARRALHGRCDGTSWRDGERCTCACHAVGATDEDGR